MLLETPAPDFGSAAAHFRLPDAQGNIFATGDIAQRNGLVVAFICNHCPYVIGIADRIAADFKELEAAGIGTVLINANDFDAYPQDAPEHMPGFAEKHGLTSPYLIDETQDTARHYGAVCTPDFFGFDADLKLRYRGRLDDAGRGAVTERTADLRDAMLAVAKGEDAPQNQMPAMGCSLKWR